MCFMCLLCGFCPGRRPSSGSASPWPPCQRFRSADCISRCRSSRPTSLCEFEFGFLNSTTYQQNVFTPMSLSQDVAASQTRAVTRASVEANRQASTHARTYELLDYGLMCCATYVMLCLCYAMICYFDIASLLWMKVIRPML